MPSTRVATTVPSTSGLQITLLHRFGHGGIRGEQTEVSWPSGGADTRRRGHDRRRTRPRRSPERPTASSTEAAAASWRWLGVPAAALDDHRVGAPGGDLLRVLGEAADGMTNRQLFEPADQLLGVNAERCDLDAFADHQINSVACVACVGADVDAERFVSGRFDLPDRTCRRASWWPRPKHASRPRWRSRRPDGAPGYLAHSGLHHRVLDTEQLSQRRAQFHSHRRRCRAKR